MPFIASRNFATGNQQYLNLTADDYLRTLNIGSQWTRIRIGILCALGTVDETGWPIRTASLCIGVCSTVKSSVSLLSPANCWGFGCSQHPSNSTASYAYNAGTAGNSYYTCGNFAFFKVENGVLASGSVGSLTVTLPTTTTLGGALARRGMVVADISKSARVSGNITQGAMSTAAGHMGLDIVANDLYAAMESVSAAPTIQGVAMGNLAIGNSLTFNETTYGLLDTVYVYWNHYTVPLQLYEIAVYLIG